MDERSRALGSLNVALAAAVCCGVLAPPVASAQEPAVRVVLPSCPGGYGGLRLRRLLILELTDGGAGALELVSADDADPSDADPSSHEASSDEASAGRVTVRLEAACEGAGAIELAVRGGAGEPQVRQRLDLSEIGESARARAIAVAAAEQVRLQRLLAEEARENPRPTPPALAPPTVRAEVVVEPEVDDERPPALRGPEAALPSSDGVPVAGSLHVAFEARGFPELTTWPVGARVGGRVRLFDVLVLGFDLGPAFAAVERDAARVELWLVTVGFTVGARWPVSPEVALLGALHADLGYASFTGFTRAPVSSRGEGLSFALLATLGLDFAIGARVGFFVELDVGAAVVAQVAAAGDEDLAGTRGVALALRPGFRFSL